MTSPGWLTRSLADVPTDDGWLGARGVEVLAGAQVREASCRLAPRALRVEGRGGDLAGRAARAGGARSSSRRRPRGLARRPPRPGLPVTQPSGGARARCGGAKRTLRSAAFSSWSNRAVGRSSTTARRRPSAGWWRAEPGWAASARRLKSGRRQRRGGRVVEQALKLVAFEFRAGFRVEPQAPGHELGVGGDVVTQHRPQRPAVLRHQRP